MTTTQTHDARVVRRLRRGAWCTYAICPCGWTRPASNDDHAGRLVGKHNQQPGERS